MSPTTKMGAVPWDWRSVRSAEYEPFETGLPQQTRAAYTAEANGEDDIEDNRCPASGKEDRP